MLRKLLSKLFQTDSLDEEYHAKLGHIVYSLLIMGVGSNLWFYDGLAWLGTGIFIIGFLLGIVVMLCLNMEKNIQYWDRVSNVIDTLHKINNPEVWEWAYRVFGIEVPDKLNKVTIVEKEDKGQGLFSLKFHDVSIPPNQMNMIANKVLGSGSLDLPEQVYGNVIPNFRTVRKQWISEGILVPKNKRNVKNGYCLSRKGLNVMYQFASENMKLKEENK